MTMAKLGAAGAGAGDYYTSLARDDYYTQGGEPPGQWCGEAAEQLRLAGAVSERDFKNLLHGRDSGGAALVKGAGEKHSAGWDLTLSAPKSVSVLWAMTEDARVRAEIQAAQQAAVQATLAFAEANCAWTRRGAGGKILERAAGLAVATFEHSTSREKDPQLHTHCVVANVALLEAGGYGTLDSRHLYQWKMALGALYRAELASQLQERLNLHIERDGSSFAITGVPKAVQSYFSKRAEQIQEWLAAHGYRGALAAQAATLDTRQAKPEIDRPELFARWQAEGREAQWGPEQAAALHQEPPRQEALPAPEMDAIREGLTEKYSTFAERQAWQAMAVEMQGVGGLAEIEKRMESFWRDPEIIQLKDDTFGFGRWSTESMRQLEERVVEAALAGAGEKRHGVAEEQVESRLQARQARPDQQLNAEQAAAVRYLCQHSGAVAVLEGMAGTGKSRLLDAARETWSAAGYRVVGAALSGKAALGLQESAGIASQTLHARLKEWQEPGALDRKTVIVIDEAGMVDSRKMAKIVNAAREAGAKLVLVGDHRQLQPIEAGGIFYAISTRLVKADLSAIIRQREEWARAAVHDIANGRAKEAIDAYAARGFVHEADTKKGTMLALVAAWAKAGERYPEGSRLILAGERADVRALNGHVRAHLQQTGQLGEGQKIVAADGPREFAPGDRIVFTRNSTPYGVRNGQLGTLEKIEKRGARIALRVRLDDAALAVSIPLDRYNHFDHGYALTTHKAQGVTVDRSFVLAGGEMANRELGLVQLSRHRESADLFVDRSAYEHEHGRPRAPMAPKEPATARGPNPPKRPGARASATIEQLVNQLKVSHRKDTTLDHESTASLPGNQSRGKELD